LATIEWENPRLFADFITGTNFVVDGALTRGVQFEPAWQGRVGCGWGERAVTLVSMNAHEEIEAYLEAASRFLDLPIRPEHRADALAAFAVLAAHGRLLKEFSLPEEVEAAPRYQP
jgi:hypothetical protein